MIEVTEIRAAPRLYLGMQPKGCGILLGVPAALFVGLPILMNQFQGMLFGGDKSRVLSGYKQAMKGNYPSSFFTSRAAESLRQIKNAQGPIQAFHYESNFGDVLIQPNMSRYFILAVRRKGKWDKECIRLIGSKAVQINLEPGNY